MRPQSLLSQQAQVLLRGQKKPRSMRWILEKLEEKYMVDHRALWNVIWNGCVAPVEKPRFRCIRNGSKFEFEINR